MNIKSKEDEDNKIINKRKKERIKFIERIIILSFYLILINLIIIKSDDVDNYNPIDIDDFDFDIPYIPYNNAIIDDEIIIHRPVIDIPYILTTNDETFLGNCSVILRNIYNIPDNEKFTISREYISNNPSPINLTVYANKWHFNAITFRHLHQL